MKEIVISGVRVSFPFSPYPCQISYMEKVLKSLQNKKCAILESPTGTGKTLSLLCSTLSWQISQYSKDNAHISLKILHNHMEDYNSEDDFKSQNHKSFEESDINNTKDSNYLSKKEGNIKDMRVPQIIYSTRTHKQISQIIQELNKVELKKNIKMTILSSRKNTCIHPQVSRQSDLNERCSELLKSFDKGCKFYQKLNSGGYARINYFNRTNNIWDIEDLNAFGYQHELCPYFASRSLISKSDIIFCPYNYVLDGIIRGSIPNFETRDQIIIFDEAHNIEDVCRDASSLSLEFSSLKTVETFFSSINVGTLESYRFFSKLIDSLVNWMMLMHGRLVKRSYDDEDYFLSGPEMLAQLNYLNIGPGHFDQIKKVYNTIKTQDKSLFESNTETETEHGSPGKGNSMEVEASKERNENEGEELNPNKSRDQILGERVRQWLFESKHMKVIESIVATLENMYKENQRYFSDYRLLLTKRMKFRNKTTEQVASKDGLNLEQSDEKLDGITDDWNYTFNLLCMNPAIAMQDLVKNAHSIIITSGTLSPLKSFSSELGISFDYLYEAPHIISPERLWVSSIGSTYTHDFRNKRLKFVYKNIHNLEFQDDVGDILLNVLQIQFGYGGILCFFPSYSMIDKYIARWKLTGLWDHLTNHRTIFIEPRFSFELTNDVDTVDVVNNELLFLFAFN